MVQCQKCQQEGHTRARCPEVFCGGCRQKGHRPNTCPNKASWKCNSCGQVGHAQWECTSEPPQQTFCILCREQGHLSKKCTNKEKWFCRKCSSRGHGYWECETPENKSDRKAPPPTTNAKCSKCGQSHPAMPNACQTSKTNASESDRPKSPQPHKKERPTPSVFALGLVAHGERLFSVKDHEGAIRFYTQAIDHDNRIGFIYAKRGIAYALLRKDREAISDLSSATKDDYYIPTVDYHVHSARCRLRLGSLAAAMHSLRDARALNSQHSDVRVLQTRLEDLDRFRARYETTSAADNWRAAKVAYESCLEIYKQESCQVPVEVQRWGIELMITDGTHLDKTETEIRSLLKESRPSEILYLLALLCLLRDKLPECLSQLKDILMTDPDYPEAQQLRTRVKAVVASRSMAVSAVGRKDWLEAREQYSTALKSVELYQRRGNGGILRANLCRDRASVLREMRQYEDAIKDLNVCLSILPDNFEALYLRARTFITLELYDSAVSDLMLAAEVAPPLVAATIANLMKATEAKRTQAKDFYKILGLSRSCSRLDIKKAYRVESLKHHPDKGGLPERFSAIAEAYETLSDTEKRAEYDRQHD